MLLLIYVLCHKAAIRKPDTTTQPALCHEGGIFWCMKTTNTMKLPKEEAAQTVIIVDYPEHNRLAYFVSTTDNQPQEITVTFDKDEATTYPDISTSLKECSRLLNNAEGRRVKAEFSTCYKSHASLIY